MSSRLMSSLKKTGGRNSAGRITSFHRGGGAKRQFRHIDLKRTDSSLGVVERIEYDPNRSSRIALVRWQEGVKLKRPSPKDVFTKPSHLLESSVTAAAKGPYYLSNLCPDFISRGNEGGAVRNASTAAYAVVGAPAGAAKSAAFDIGGSGEGKKMGVRDVFLSAFRKGDAASEFSLGKFPIIPRMVVAGAKSAYFVAKERGAAEGKDSFTLGEIGKWRADSAMWNHRIKRQGAISWHSYVNDGKVTVGLVGSSSENKGAKAKAKAGKDRKKGNAKIDRTPVSYIIASHNQKPGDMVMNYNKSKSYNNALV